MKLSRIGTFAIISILPLLLVGCGGGSGGGSSALAVAGPTASITFPPRSALIDASSIVVSGIASDPDGVSDVSVNGFSATTSDEFATWSVTVPVARGLNILRVETTDTLGNSISEAARADIQNELLSPRPVSLAIDATNNRVLVLDEEINALISVNLDSGMREILSANTIPNSGSPFRHPRAIDLDLENNRALVLDTGAGELLAVDLTTGVRTTISDDLRPSDENPINFFTSSSILLDAARNRVLINYGDLEFVSSGFVFLPTIRDGSILAIDLVSGVRTIISDQTTPDANLPLNRPDAIALDVDSNRIIVIENNPDGSQRSALVAVDLDTGSRSLVSGEGFPFSDSLLFFPSGLAIDRDNNRALVFERLNDALIAVDLANGAQSLVSEEDREGFFGSAFAGVPVSNNIAFDRSAGRILYTGSVGNAIHSIDLATRQRTVFSEISHVPDSDNVLSSTTYLAFDGNRNRIIVADILANKILSVDPESGSRTLIYEPESEILGILGVFPGSVALYDEGEKLLFVEQEFSLGGVVFSLVSLDLTTGVKSHVSTLSEIENGISIGFPAGLSLDRDNRRVFVSDGLKVIAIDLDTGQRSLFFESESLFDGFSIADFATLPARIPTTGTAVPADIPISLFSSIFRALAMAVDQTNNRLLVADPTGAILAVDLDTGVDTLLSPFDFEFFGFGVPQSITIDEVRNRALVINVLGDIVAVDLISGERASFTGDEIPGMNTPLYGARGIAIDSTNHRAFVLGEFLNAIYVVNLQNGQRAILSR